MGDVETPEDVFRLLADDGRLDILRTIAEAQAENMQSGVAALSFSEIYEEVDIDNTSKLSYHLGELMGTFLRKEGDTYAFTHAGDQLSRFILSENFRSPPDIDPMEVEGACLFCGETALETALHSQFFMLECTNCGQPAYAYRVRPAEVRARSGEELIDAVIWEQCGDILKARNGVCPECAGRLDTAVIDASEIPAQEVPSVPFATLSECEQCLRALSLPLTHTAAYHPAAIAFHWDHGIDVLGSGIWTFNRFLAEDLWTASRVDGESDRFQVEFSQNRERLRLELDRSGTVTEIQRVRERGGASSRS